MFIIVAIERIDIDLQRVADLFYSLNILCDPHAGTNDTSEKSDIQMSAADCVLTSDVQLAASIYLASTNCAVRICSHPY